MTETHTHQACPNCGQAVQSSAPCPHCGTRTQVKHKRLMSSGMPSADYGVFLLAAPLITAAGLLILALTEHSLAGLLSLLALTVLLCALLAALEIFQAPAAWASGSAAAPMRNWCAAITLLWPAGYPGYLRGRRRFGLNDWFVAALVVEVIFLASATGAAFITASGYGEAPPQVAVATPKDSLLLTGDRRWLPDADDIDIVRTGHLENCPQKTLDQEVAGYFEAPHWEAGATADAVDFVTARGTVTYQGKPAEALLQFVMDKDKAGFRYQIFAINGVPQPLYVATFTMAQMCG